MTIRSLILAAATAATIAGATSASAATVVLKNTVATWQSAVGGANVTYTGSGSSSASVKWGSPSWEPQSRYKFQVAGNTLSTTLPPSPSDPFKIGTFTHYNEPINANSSITAVQLKLSTTIFIDGVSQGARNFLFDFNHNETPNVGWGNCCADIVTFVNNPQSDSFSYGGMIYTLNFTGFEHFGQHLSQFSSKEGGTNSAKLYATLSATPETVPGVPEPATWVAMLAGFGMVGAALRRQPRPVTVLA